MYLLHHEGFVDWFLGRDDEEFIAAYKQRRENPRWSNRNRWLEMIVGHYPLGMVEDRSYFPTDANMHLCTTEYKRWASNSTQGNLCRQFFPQHQPIYVNTDGEGPLKDLENSNADCTVAFNLCEIHKDPLAVAARLCETSSCVIFDIPVARKTHIFPTHTAVFFEDLMRLTGRYDLVAYQYYVREYAPFEFETFYLLYRVPREQTFIGAKLFWKSLEKVKTLEHRFLETVDSLQQEILEAYGDLAGRSVLDLGCGTGRLPAAFPNLGVYIGVDQSEMMLSKVHVHIPEDAELVLAPIREYKLQSHFHVIAAIDVLQHSERPRDLALYILNHFCSDCILYRTIVNELDYPVYHITKMGTTSVSMPVSYYEQLAHDLAKRCNGSAEIFHCTPFEGENKARTKTHGIILKVTRGDEQ